MLWIGSPVDHDGGRERRAPSSPCPMTVSGDEEGDQTRRQRLGRGAGEGIEGPALGRRQIGVEVRRTARIVARYGAARERFDSRDTSVRCSMSGSAASWGRRRRRNRPAASRWWRRSARRSVRRRPAPSPADRGGPPSGRRQRSRYCRPPKTGPCRPCTRARARPRHCRRCRGRAPASIRAGAARPASFPCRREIRSRPALHWRGNGCQQDQGNTGRTQSRMDRTHEHLSKCDRDAPAPFYSTGATLNRFAEAKNRAKKSPRALRPRGFLASGSSRYGAFSTISVNG